MLPAYWTCCLLYYIACPLGKCDKYGLLSYNAYIQNYNVFKFDKYVTNAFVVLLYYVLSMLSRFNLSVYFEYTPQQMIIAYLIILSGSFLMIFFTAELTASFFVRCRHKTNYNLYIRAINQYLAVNKVAQHLRTQVSEVLQFQWYYNENTTVVGWQIYLITYFLYLIPSNYLTGKKGILTDAPEYLRDIIVYERIVNCLSNVPLFRGCTKSFLKAVASKMIFKVLPPGALVTAADNRSRWMHCIVRGYCTQHSIMPGDRERNRATILKPGDSFPVVEMLHEVW